MKQAVDDVKNLRESNAAQASRLEDASALLQVCSSGCFCRPVYAHIGNHLLSDPMHALKRTWKYGEQKERGHQVREEPWATLLTEELRLLLIGLPWMVMCVS